MLSAFTDETWMVSVALSFMGSPPPSGGRRGGRRKRGAAEAAPPPVVGGLRRQVGDLRREVALHERQRVVDRQREPLLGEDRDEVLAEVVAVLGRKLDPGILAVEDLRAIFERADQELARPSSPGSRPPAGPTAAWSTESCGLPMMYAPAVSLVTSIVNMSVG
jgi:hypothetical protein